VHVGRALQKDSFMPNRKVLVLYAHPNHANSRVNAALRLAAQSVAGVTVHDLYESYPEFVIDVAHEQALLLEHDVVVLQHPLQWYSAPAIIKEWLDAVLEEGWAYGAGGTQLAGKTLLMAVTSGGGENAYQSNGTNRFTIAQLLRPFELTARLCGMRYLSPFVSFAARRIEAREIASRTHDYRVLLAQLTQGELPPPYDSRHHET
jgi:glutathione-regulated potassium-efflux system ancillary protein KefG